MVLKKSMEICLGLAIYGKDLYGRVSTTLELIKVYLILKVYLYLLDN